MAPTLWDGTHLLKKNVLLFFFNINNKLLAKTTEQSATEIFDNPVIKKILKSWKGPSLYRYSVTSLH